MCSNIDNDNTKNMKCVHGHTHHEGSLYKELMYHLPYAIFSVCFSLAILSFLGYFSFGFADRTAVRKGANVLFHSFHFMHILFSATGTLITYYRFSKGILRGLFVGVFSALVFCTLSDAIMPYLAGKFLGVNMVFHLCLFQELDNIIPFLIAGLVTGVVVGRYHKSNDVFYSVFSHALHILVSSFASMFYLVANGHENWYSKIGPVFLFLTVCVVVPCIMSDIVTPMTFAKADKKKADKKNERNKIS